MIEVRIDSNINRIKLQFGNLVQGVEDKAMVRALNRAGDQSVTAASREIRRVYNISAGFARKQIKVRDRARKGKLYFTIRIFSRRIPLSEFKPRQTRRGVSISVKKGSRKLIPRAFLARMKSGHLGVVVRAFSSAGLGRGEHAFFRFGKGSGKPGRAWGEADLPIAELTTLSVPRMFLERTVRSAVSKVAVDSFNKNFEQQLRFLSGGGA